jgi:acyl-CoA reductase-like NAD-dependent aldehyde dehydrogenase
LQEPLARVGAYTSVYTADIKETQQLLYHPAVQAVHMTGETGVWLECVRHRHT